MCAQTISKLNVIGERQRFGLRVLEAGFNVLFADLDNIFLKSPAPLLAEGMGDIIGERIWGRPLSVVKKWGAGICTGFYFVRTEDSDILLLHTSVRSIRFDISHQLVRIQVGTITQIRSLHQQR